MQIICKVGNMTQGYESVNIISKFWSSFLFIQ